MIAKRIISTSVATIALTVGIFAGSSTALAANEVPAPNEGTKDGVINPMKKTDIDPRVIKTVSSKGCTAKIIEFKARNWEAVG